MFWLLVLWWLSFRVLACECAKYHLIRELEDLGCSLIMMIRYGKAGLAAYVFVDASKWAAKKPQPAPLGFSFQFSV